MDIQHLSLFGVLGVCFAIARYLDKHINIGIRRRLISTFYGSADTVSEKIAVFYTLLDALFRPASRGSFVFRTSLLSIAAMTLLLSSQNLLLPGVFTESTMPFISEAFKLNIRVILILAGFVLVDCLSVYVTLIFLRISKGCESFKEFFFVSFADALVSLIIVGVFIPLVITVSFLINPRFSELVEVVVAGSQLPQRNWTDQQIRDLLVFDPSSEIKILTPEDMDKQRESAWIARQWTIRFSNREDQHSLMDIIRKSDWNSSIVIQSKGLKTDDEIVAGLLKALNGSKAVKNAELTETYSNPFGVNYSKINIRVDPTIDSRLFLHTYLNVAGDMSFFNNNFLNY